MKKWAAILLGGAMFATAVSGLAACKPASVTLRADPRAADAYTAYDHEGTPVGSYKTIADAINATVTADLDYFEDDAVPNATKGGYVTRKDGTRHLFENKKGYTENYDDQYWFYEDGNKLAGYDAWDENPSMTFLRNNKMVVHKVTGYGLTPVQSWNGYGLIDEYGDEDTKSDNPASWALGTAIDAGVMVFPSSAGGTATGMSRDTYKIDLTEMRITPPYDGTADEVYAYLGFYIWTPQYVLAIGIGCNTKTGKWYEFRGTSRDDSFSDVEYDLGDCLLESTWDEKNGCFTPNAKELEISVQTVKMVDEEFGEEYFVCQFKADIRGGKKDVTLNRLIDDELMAPYFSERIHTGNDFLFIAGLDIKNPVATGVKVKNVDYFNGAKLEGLCVTEAGVYFPTEEEISDDDFTELNLDPSLRGNTYDFLLANDVDSEGNYGYTILSNYMCANYTAKDGADYYDFRFDGDPVGETELGGNLKEYQEKIDSLSAMTVENYLDYLAAYEEAGKWYGKDETHEDSTLGDMYLNLLDFSTYLAAKEVYLDAMHLSTEGQEVLNSLNKLGLVTATNYPYQGWTRDAEHQNDPILGWFWEEAQEFDRIRTALHALDASEQTKVMNLYNSEKEGNFEDWANAYDSVKAYLDNSDYTSKSYTVADMSMNGTDITYTGETALQKLLAITFRIRENFWPPAHSTQEPNVLNSDVTANFQAGFHLLFLRNKVEEAGVKLPKFFDDMLDLITNTPRSGNFMMDFDEYIYPVLTLAGKIYKEEQEGGHPWLSEEVADVVNEYMIDFTFSDAGFSWNFTNSGDLRDGNTNYEHYFGLPDAPKSFKASVDYIIQVVQQGDPTAELTANGIAFKEEVTPLESDPADNISPEAKAVREAFQAFSSMPKYEYKGWKAPEGTDVKGYLYSELQSFKTNVYTPWKALTEAQQAEVRNTVLATSLEAWLALAEEEDILESYPALAQVNVNTYENPKTETTKDFSGMELFDQYVYWLYRIYVGGDFGKYNDYGKGTGTMSMDTSPFPSAYLCLLRDYLPAGFEMPAFLQETWEAVQDTTYGDFYETAYYPIYNSVKLAVRIHNEHLNAISQLTKEELAFLNDVWVSDYTLGGHISWNWISGKKFETYMSDRTLQIAKYAGGNFTKDDADHTPYKTYEYIEIVGQFLEDCGYTLDDAKNGWGVTDSTITAPVEEAPIQTKEDVIAEFNKLSNVTDMAAYAYKGWTTMGADLKGYLYSEATHFGKILMAYKALGGDDQSAVNGAVNSANWTAWTTLSDTLIKYVTAVEGKQIAAATADSGASRTYTAAEALAELLNALSSIPDGKVLDSDNTWASSFRVYFLLAELNALDATLPDFVNTMVAAKEKTEGGTGQLSSDLKADVRYLSIVLKLAKKLQDNPAYKLTAEEIAEVNATMVGKTRFQENGLNWNFHPETGEMGDRGSNFVVYFGLSKDHNFGYYLDLVTKYLIDTYKATGAGYTGQQAAIIPEYNMGITAAISAQN